MPHLVMLTSFNQDTLSKQAQSVKIAKILNKPVSTSSLFDTAIKLLSDEYVQFIPTVVPESSHSIQGAQVLLVEDNGLNQEVGVELLKEVGVWADVAENGAIALQKIQEKNYDLVLMDIQMPVMDGVTATIEIRKLPQFADLPIVAMTANAMRQDREHCLAVGMNDHLAKPIEPQDLWAMLHKWIKPRLFNFSAEKVKKESSDTMTIPNDIAGLDTTLGLRRMAGKQELYVSMLKKFVDNQKSAIENIQTALAENDLITAERLAHTLKGLAGNIGAVSLQKQTEQLELALHSHVADEKLNPILANVALSLAQLIAALKLQFEPTANTRIDTPMLTQEIDQAILQKVVVELINLLADDDAEAVNYFAKNEKLLHGVFPIQFKLLQKWVCNYDFVDALNTLKQAAAQKQII
jgi:CheY-like chemotaxis protein